VLLGKHRGWGGGMEKPDIIVAQIPSASQGVRFFNKRGRYLLILPPPKRPSSYSGRTRWRGREGNKNILQTNTMKPENGKDDTY